MEGGTEEVEDVGTKTGARGFEPDLNKGWSGLDTGAKLFCTGCCNWELRGVVFTGDTLDKDEETPEALLDIGNDDAVDGTVSGGKVGAVATSDDDDVDIITGDLEDEAFKLNDELEIDGSVELF